MKPTCNDREGADKRTHELVCCLIALAAGMTATAWSAASLAHMWTWLAALIGFVTAIIAGVAKELFDSRQKGNHFCVWDIVADARGALEGSVIVWLTSFLLMN